MPGRDFNVGAKRGREARAAFGLDEQAPLPDLLDVVEQAGMRVVVASLREGVAGACVRRPEGAVLFVNGDEPAVRQRFTLAHELGHVRCDHDGAVVVDTFETLSGKRSSSYEVQANSFAAEFLIPKVALTLDGEPTLEDVARIAATFGTSMLMTLFRLRQCKVGSTARLDALREELDGGQANEVIERLELHWPEDRLAAKPPLPYLSPRLADSLLGAAVRGDAAADPALAGAIARLLL